MTKRLIPFGVVAMLLLLCLASAEARKWTSSDGRFTVEAECVDATTTSVRLKKVDGKIISIPISKLSKEDQQHVATLPKASVPASSDLSPEKAKELLQKKGLRVASLSLSLRAESKLSTGLKDLFKNRRKLAIAGRKLTITQQRINEAKHRATMLTQLNVRLNAQLTAVSPQHVTLNNKLVGAINVNIGQIRLLGTVVEQTEKQVRAEMTSIIGIREAYLTAILKLREQADGIQETYKTLAADPQVTLAVAELNKTATRPLKMAPSTSLVRSIRQLASVEETVLSAAIPLRKTRGNSLYASVTINGEHAAEMVVDSGASLLVLPMKMAIKFGVEPTSQDPTIRLQIADGSVIQGKEIVLKSVRVGKFTVKNVRAAVLEAKAIAAEPLLGMSFLGKFKFELNTAESTLTLTQLEAEE